MLTLWYAAWMRDRNLPSGAQELPPETTTEPSLATTSPFPFTAIVGQEDLKLAILLAVIDPSIGGVLVTGHRGTAKSTAVRALALRHGRARLCPRLWPRQLLPHAMHKHPRRRRRFRPRWRGGWESADILLLRHATKMTPLFRAL